MCFRFDACFGVVHDHDDFYERSSPKNQPQSNGHHQTAAAADRKASNDVRRSGTYAAGTAGYAYPAAAAVAAAAGETAKQPQPAARNTKVAAADGYYHHHQQREPVHYPTGAAPTTTYMADHGRY